MSGTIKGGLKAAQTNYAKYGKNFYQNIGAKGGRNGHTGGFAEGEAGRKRAIMYGAVGGRMSIRGSSLQGLKQGNFARPSTISFYTMYMTIVFRVANKCLLDKRSKKWHLPEQMPPSEMYSLMKEFINCDSDWQDERVRMMAGVLSKLRRGVIHKPGYAREEMANAAEMKSMLVDISERAGITWVQAARWEDEFETAFKTSNAFNGYEMYI